MWRKPARQLGVSFYLTEVDVEALAKSRGLSVEEAGPQVRYRAFYEAGGKLWGGSYCGGA